LSVENEHMTRARRIGLLDLATKELDWSGMGMHVQYTAWETPPLEHLRLVAEVRSAPADKVLCRRILLTRKTMICSRRPLHEDALKEVIYMKNLSHRHFARLVGTYYQGREGTVNLDPSRH